MTALGSRSKAGPKKPKIDEKKKKKKKAETRLGVPLEILNSCLSSARDRLIPLLWRTNRP